MKSASEYYHEDWEPEYLDGNLTLSREDAYKYAQAYASYRIEQLLDVEEEIQRCFKLSSSMSNSWQESLMDQKIEAKWLLETLKNKANFIKCT